MRYATILVVAFVVGLSPVLARNPAPERAGQAASPTGGDAPCVVDERLSLVLSLESVDRMIASLESERRGLVAEIAEARKMLDMLDRGGEDVPLAELGTLMSAKSAGEDAIDDAYAGAETRLVDIDRTLKRRRALQATLEDRLEALLGASPTGSN